MTGGEVVGFGVDVMRFLKGRVGGMIPGIGS
jgi:hypothetical protein